MNTISFYYFENNQNSWRYEINIKTEVESEEDKKTKAYIYQLAIIIIDKLNSEYTSFSASYKAFNDRIFERVIEHQKRQIIYRSHNGSNWYNIQFKGSDALKEMFLYLYEAKEELLQNKEFLNHQKASKVFNAMI